MSPPKRMYAAPPPRAQRCRDAAMLLLAYLVLLPGGVSGETVGSAGTGTRGVQVTMEVPFATESPGEARALAPPLATKALKARAIPFRRMNRHPGGGTGVPLATPPVASASSVPEAVAARVAPRAPVLENSFAGLGNPPPGQDVIPPDTMGAAGPNHLVTLMNSEFGVFDKGTGSPLQRLGLQAFWASLGTGPGQPADFPFDTKVLYDQHAGRFAAVTLGGTGAGVSWILIAVSSSSDPTQSWSKWAIPSSPDNTVWADYPGFGLDAFNLYVTANMYDDRDGYRYSKVWVIPKPQLLAGTNPITWTEFPNPPGSDSSMQPAHTFGTPGTEYFLFEDRYASASTLQLAKIDNVAGTPRWQPPATVAVTPYTATTFLPGAPQAGIDNKIDTSDTRLLNAVHRNGYLWTTHTVAVNGKTEVAWYRINPVTRTVSAQGRIRDTLRWFYYPSIAVNANDVAAFGFSGSSTIEFAGGYYAVLRPPHSAADPVALLKSGEASYYKVLSKGDNRWGDFSATVVDPSDDATFWTLQEYAKTPLDQGTSPPVSQWGTWWGKFLPSEVAAPGGLTATASTLPQVVLNWTDLSGNETGFRIERRRLPGEDYGHVMTLGPNVTNFTDNASYGLLGGSTYSYRVLAFDAAGGSYSGEAFASTVAPPPPPSSDGGGGCLAMEPSSGSKAEVSSILSVVLLFLPAALFGWRRWFGTGKR